MAEGHNTESDFKCTICLSYFTEPRLLPCYHIFCTPCLEKLVDDTKSINCPLCRKETSIPTEGVCGFKVHPFDLLQNENKHETDICLLCCDESIADVKCLDCQVNLCANCRNYHGKLKVSKNHKLENVQRSVTFDTDESTAEKECVEHRKEFTLFCRPCNKLICIDCKKESHDQHEAETVASSAKLKRNLLLARIANLKTKVIILENYVEVIKEEDRNYCKHVIQLKKEIQSRATVLKEVFCKNIDFLTETNINYVESIKCKDVKLLQTHLDEVETEKLSTSCLYKTAENLTKNCNYIKLLNEFFPLSIQLDKNIQNTIKAFPVIHQLQCANGKLDLDSVRQLFGRIVCTEANRVTAPVLFGLPVFDMNIQALKITSFNTTNKVLGIAASCKDKVWVWTKGLLSQHSLEGTLISNCVPPEKSTKIMRKYPDEVWFWVEQFAERPKGFGQNGYRVNFSGGVGCCFIHNGNLLVFNPQDKSLLEVSENSNIERTITNEKLQSLLTVTSCMIVAETKNFFNLVISQGGDTVIITDENGTVKNTFTRPKARFQAVATDINGNILVADYQNDFLSILTEDGIIYRELLTHKKNGIYSIEHIGVNEDNILWFSHNAFKEQAVNIYSYL